MLDPTLAGTLRPLRAKLVPALCSDAEFDALDQLAVTLPPVSATGFERRLHRDPAGLDLSICVRAGQRAAGVLRDGGHGGAPLRSLLAAVEDPSSPLHGRLDLLWLEYDVSRASRTPSLFVGPLGDDRRDVVVHASALVLGEPLAHVVTGELEQLAAPLSGVQLFQVGWMLGRSKPGLRLCFCASDLDSFDGLLARLDSAPLRSLLRASCRRYAAHVTQFVLAVDIGEGEVGPRVGLELGYGGAQHAVLLQRWDALLQALVDDGLCTQTLLVELLRWPGRVLESASLRGSGGLLRSYERHLDRLLHHVKLVIEDHELREAKVYFGVQHGWAAT